MDFAVYGNTRIYELLLIKLYFKATKETIIVGKIRVEQKYDERIASRCKPQKRASRKQGNFSQCYYGKAFQWGCFFVWRR